MNPTHLPKDYEPRPHNQPYEPDPPEPFEPPLDYDEQTEYDEDEDFNDGMGHNFWMGVCHGLAIIIVIAVCSFALYSLGAAVIGILTQ